jgi:DNA repair photolyase
MHSRGVQTFVFIGPILPGKPHKLVETLAGKVDRVYVDRMNYVSSIKGFYYKHGLKEAASDDFFQRFKNELVGALRKYQIPYDVFF